MKHATLTHATCLHLLLLCWIVSFQTQRVIDGDTFIATIPIWVFLTATESVRILGVDTPELNRPGGTEARTFTETWLAQGPAQMTVCKRDGFGRVLAHVSRGAENLATALIEAGHGGAR